MYPYDNYDQNNEQNSWDPNTGLYHYRYTRPQPEPPRQPPRKQQKGRGKLRAVALVLCCALVGGGAGIGGAALYQNLWGGGAKGETTIYQNTTPPTAVSISQADGLTPMSLSEIYATYADACVCVNISGIKQEGRYQYETAGAGSGFIISEDGYIVTNYHVIKGATAINVTLNNGDVYDASLIGGEEAYDVAVLKIDGVTGLTPVVLGDSDTLVVGATVSTIGNALGSLSFSQTSGGVSATDRTITMKDGALMNMIQTDCTINSGNSGGPLFDSYGRVVGITSAKYSNNGASNQAIIEGIGFAIPINDVLDMVTDFMEFGYITGRPSMGITVATVTEEWSATFNWPYGGYVNSVEPGSCAERAGLRQGDIITAIGGKEVATHQELIAAKNTYKAGETTELTVFRAGETLTLTITFDEQDAAAQSSGQSNTPDNSQNTTPDNGQNGGQYDYSDPFYYDPWGFFFGD